MNVQEIQKDLTELKKGIDSAKTNLAKMEGRESELLAQLQKNHGLSSVEEINKKVAELTKEIAAEELSIETDYKTLKEEYSW